MSKDQQLRWAEMVSAVTRKYTNDQLVAMSVEYGKKGRLAPICTPMDTLKDVDLQERGLFTPIDDPVFRHVIIAQAQYKMTETPPRTKWACRPVGYDNGFIYLKCLSYGPEGLKKLEAAGII